MLPNMLGNRIEGPAMPTESTGHGQVMGNILELNILRPDRKGVDCLSGIGRDHREHPISANPADREPGLA